jgi:hypothetical protein
MTWIPEFIGLADFSVGNGCAVRVVFGRSGEGICHFRFARIEGRAPL